MKKKLIAMILTTTLVGGIATTTYAATNSNTEIRVEASTNQDNIEDNQLETRCGSAQDSSNIVINETSSSENIGVIRRICVNIENFFNNLCDYIKNLVCGGSSDNIENNPQKGEDNTDNVIEDNNQNNSSQDNNSDGNSSDSVVPPVVEQPEETQPEETQPEETIPVVTIPSGNNSTTTPEEKPSTPSVSDSFMAQVEQMIFEKVNAERAKAGAPQLSYNNTMQKYARIKSQDMGERGYFDHKDPSGNLITSQMQKDGVRYSAWGENIAYISGVSDANALANQFMTNWMNSSGHRANILSTNFDSIGIGVYKIGNTVYATQEFYR